MYWEYKINVPFIDHYESKFNGCFQVSILYSIFGNAEVHRTQQSLSAITIA